MPDVVTTAIGGLDYRGYQRGGGVTAGTDQYVVPVYDRVTSFAGRAASFRIPGNAATTQTLATLHNATGSAVLVNVDRIIVDELSTAAKAITVIPPVLRLYLITALPTGGTLLNKVGFDSTYTSSASVTVRAGASADRTASAITATIPTTTRLAEFTSVRTITGAGIETSAPYIFLDGAAAVTLRALEGIAVVLEDTVVTTGNPATDTYTVAFEWEEFQRP